MSEDYEYPDQYEVDGDDEDTDAHEDCGRWINGRLGRYCRLAGTEQCDWECPYSR